MYSTLHLCTAPAKKKKGESDDDWDEEESEEEVKPKAKGRGRPSKPETPKRFETSKTIHGYFGYGHPPFGVYMYFVDAFLMKGE